jgi:ABC-type multidrug transport system ATPase subunit
MRREWRDAITIQVLVYSKTDPSLLKSVRESLQFSALLRQPKEVSRADKLAFAEEVIHLLELESIADALIGDADIGGLGVEERKRVTIGVELAAKPDTLLFLDEREQTRIARGFNRAPNFNH